MDVEQAPQQQGNKQRYRGKLYVLSEDSAWEDTGTGHASIALAGNTRRLVFRHEDSGEVLYDRPVFSSDTYQLQGDGERQTIIVWEDPESKKDWALSFQDPDGTSEIWSVLSQEPVQKRYLPLPTLSNLSDLARMLTCVPPSQREMLAAECLSPAFLEGLREAFHTAEDLNSEEALTPLWHITKNLFLLSSQRLTERYLSSDVYEDVLGMLEYDCGLPSDKHTPHRQVLKSRVKFNEVLDFEDQAILERIHLNYRLQYLKDIVLPRLLDDGSLLSLQQMIHANISIILAHLHKTAALQERLLQQVQAGDLQSLLFLQDVCRLARQIAPQERHMLYEGLVQKQLYPILAPFLAEDGERRQRHVSVELLVLSACHDPSQLRSYLTSDGNAEARALLSALIRVLHTEQDLGVQGQAAEVLKAVMDISALERKEHDSCLDVFYERGALDEIVAPLQQEEEALPAGPAAAYRQQVICELLAFAVVCHGYRARVYLIRHGLVQRAMRLMAAPQRFLQLAPVRLLRALVGAKDEVYHRYLAKNSLFAPLLQSFQQCLQPPCLGGNLVVSTTLEMLEFIRMSNVKLLVDHICRKHGALLQAHAPKFKILEGLLLRHQQNQEYEAFPPAQHAAGGPIASSLTGGGAGKQPREDSDDDAYFDSLDDDDEAEGGSTSQEAAAEAPEKEAAAAQEPSGMQALLGSYEEEEAQAGEAAEEPEAEGKAEERALSHAAKRRKTAEEAPSEA